MKWGVSRGANGVRPIAKTLNDGPLGQLARKNVQRHYAAQSKRTEKKKARQSTNRSASAKGYTAKKQNFDREMLGRRSVNKIADRVASGEKVGVARSKSYAKHLAVTGALIAGPIAIAASSKGLSNLSSNINAKRGAAAAATILADTRGLTSYNTVSLKFDPTSGIFR